MDHALLENNYDVDRWHWHAMPVLLYTMCWWSIFGLTVVSVALCAQRKATTSTKPKTVKSGPKRPSTHHRRKENTGTTSSNEMLPSGEKSDNNSHPHPMALIPPSGSGGSSGPVKKRSSVLTKEDSRYPPSSIVEDAVFDTSNSSTDLRTPKWMMTPTYLQKIAETEKQLAQVVR